MHLSSPRDNLCGISCGANNSCRTPRIALQFSKFRYISIYKKLCYGRAFCVLQDASICKEPGRPIYFYTILCYNKKGRKFAFQNSISHKSIKIKMYFACYYFNQLFGSFRDGFVWVGITKKALLCRAFSLYFKSVNLPLL